MRTSLAAAVALAAGLFLAQPSGAVTLADPGVRPATGVTLIAGGCGLNFYRAANGYCYRRPVYAPPVRPAPPPYYYRRACGPGFHPTPYGCRPNY